MVAGRQHHQPGAYRLSIPAFMSAKEIVITKTMNNGYAVSANKNDPPESCVVFETWAAL